MKNHPGVFTTGEAAKICGWSLQTMIRIFDEGLLKGVYKAPPRFKVRRIPRESLIRFMRENSIPMNGLPEGAPGLQDYQI